MKKIIFSLNILLAVSCNKQTLNLDPNFKNTSIYGVNNGRVFFYKLEGTNLPMTVTIDGNASKSINIDNYWPNGHNGCDNVKSTTFFLLSGGYHTFDAVSQSRIFSGKIYVSVGECKSINLD